MDRLLPTRPATSWRKNEKKTSAEKRWPTAAPSPAPTPPVKEKPPAMPEGSSYETSKATVETYFVGALPHVRSAAERAMQAQLRASLFPDALRPRRRSRQGVRARELSFSRRGGSLGKPSP